MKKVLSLVAVLTLVFSLAACGGSEEEAVYEDLGYNFEGARIGLVVPSYVTIDSITELSADDFPENPKIVGIEPGAGIMGATNTAIDEYDLGMELLKSSGPAMVSELGSAIENEEWIVVTGWSPHYKFAEYDLKYLEDPEGVYGDVENLHTVARPELSTDDPDLATFLENFYMSGTELGGLMGDIAASDDDAIEVARAWMADNEDVWSAWMPEGFDGDGAELEIGYVNWAEGVAMTNLVQALLIDEANYSVEITMADAGPIFSGVTDGSIDFFLDAWLPVTHASYQEQYGPDEESSSE